MPPSLNQYNLTTFGQALMLQWFLKLSVQIPVNNGGISYVTESVMQEYLDELALTSGGTGRKWYVALAGNEYTNSLESDLPTGELSTTGTGYSRQFIKFSAATGDFTSYFYNSSNIEFGPAVGSAWNVYYILLLTVPEGGTARVVWWAKPEGVSTYLTVDVGSKLVIAPRGLLVSFNFYYPPGGNA